MDNKMYFDLIRVIEKQDELICELSKMICNVVNENLENENIINVLMQETMP